MSPRLLAPAVLVAALAAAGCGTTTTGSARNFSGPGKAVAQTLDDLSTAARKSDEQTICTQLLASALVQKLNSGGSTCQRSVNTQIDSADDTTLTVNSVKVTGSTAVAVVTSKVKGKDTRQSVNLVRENGRWRISGIG